MRSSVDLPHPDGPTSTRNSPLAISSETSSTATTPPEKTLRDVVEDDLGHRTTGVYTGTSGRNVNGIDHFRLAAL